MIYVDKVYSKYIKHDPLNVVKVAIAKTTLLMMGYIIIAAILGLNATVVIWPLIYISHVLTSVIVSPENERRKVFFLHTIIGIIVILFLPFFLKLSTYNLLFIFPIIYVVFWIKKFGDAFYTFPKLILILLCLISLRFPINMVNILHFVAVSLGLAVAFYFFVLLYLEKMFTQKYLKILVDRVINFIALEYTAIYKKSKFSNYKRRHIHDNKKANDIFISQLRNSYLFHGSTKKSKNNWGQFCYRMILLNRLLTRAIFGYRKIYIYNTGNHNKYKQTMQMVNDIGHILSAIFEFLGKYINTLDNSEYLYHLGNLKHLQYKFEITHLNQYEKGSYEHEALLRLILLIDEVLLSLERIRINYNVVLK